jgi:hypothetical protein
LDLVAEWTERGEDLKDPKSQRRIIPRNAVVQSMDIPYKSETAQMIAFHHELDNTQYHEVNYKVVANSRYREFFDQQEKAELFQNTSKEFHITFPSSQSPMPPEVRVEPSLYWIRKSSSGSSDNKVIEESTRKGAFTIYLSSSFYSSGDNEKLAVIYDFDKSNEKNAQPYVSSVSEDPLWRLDKQSTPRQLLKAKQELLVPLKENVSTCVPVDLFTPKFSKERGLTCEVMLDGLEKSYFPFVRLALAAYQEHSIEEYEQQDCGPAQLVLSCKLSQVVRSNFVQLLPERYLRAEYSKLVTESDRNIKLYIKGPAPYRDSTDDLPATEIKAVLQYLEGNNNHLTEPEKQLGWRPVGGDGAWTVLAAKQSSDKLWEWTGDVPIFIRTDVPSIAYRVMIEEQEYESGRLVYAESIYLKKKNNN